jgi:hypothetical protein
MDIGNMFNDSFEYTKEGLMGKWTKWILLIIASVIFPLIMGYQLRIMRGEKPAPEADNWVKMFVDGIVYLIISIIYMIPVMIVGFIIIGGSFMALGAGDITSPVALIGAFGIGLIIVLILAVIIELIAIAGIIRFAREGKFTEAFNFSEIMAKIGKIGWAKYFVMLFILWIALAVFYTILEMIPVIGWFLMFILMPAVAVFSSRYICLIYDSA